VNRAELIEDIIQPIPLLYCEFYQFLEALVPFSLCTFSDNIEESKVDDIIPITLMANIEIARTAASKVLDLDDDTELIKKVSYFAGEAHALQRAYDRISLIPNLINNENVDACFLAAVTSLNTDLVISYATLIFIHNPSLDIETLLNIRSYNPKLSCSNYSYEGAKCIIEKIKSGQRQSSLICLSNFYEKKGSSDLDEQVKQLLEGDIK